MKRTFRCIKHIDHRSVKLLSEAGYEEIDLELMEPEELKEAMEDAGVDTVLYDFDWLGGCERRNRWRI